jgi:AraC family transcriptional regulator
VTDQSDRRPAYGDQMGQYFRIAHAPSLVIRPPLKPQIAITRLVSKIGLPERTASIPREKAFVVSVHLTPAAEQGCDIWVDDRHSRIADWPAGGVGIYDLESNPRTRNCGPIDWVHYHVPRAMLDAFTDDAEANRIRTLECVHGTIDPILHRMTQMMVLAVESPQSFSELSLDYFRLLFCAHVAHTYDPSHGTVSEYRGGLAPWQKRRATELLAEHLDGSLRLATLARECGLSVSHFARSFRQSFGTSAHRYLILQRVDKAKQLLSDPTWSLSEVALQTGFADQAAFSRTFRAVVGTPPGQWRRHAEHRRRSFVRAVTNDVSDSTDTALA